MSAVIDFVIPYGFCCSAGWQVAIDSIRVLLV